LRSASAMLWVLCLTGAITARAGEPAADSLLPVAAGAHPSVQQIDAALAELRRDPNLPQQRTITGLQWKTQEKKPEADDKNAAWMTWLRGLFTWIGSSARLISWVLIATLAALVAVFVIRLIRARGTDLRASRFVAPAFVRDLDIRPESLPPDIGAAARALWDGGGQRRALALLYRGLLSRLVHQHRVPVRESTTEGECLRLASQHLDEQGRGFATRLIGLWQTAVYGARMPDAQRVYALCDEFDAVLAPPAAAQAAA
jgi:hypothetical protein